MYSKWSYAISLEEMLINAILLSLVCTPTAVFQEATLAHPRHLISSDLIYFH